VAALGVSALLLGLSWSAIWLLNRRVRERTAELEAANRTLSESRRDALDKAERERVARTELEQSQAQLRLTQYAMDHSPDEVVWLNESGKIVYVNETACRALGFSRAELLGREVTIFDPDYPMDRWAESRRRLRERGEQIFETRHRRKDGRMYPVEVHSGFLAQAGREYICAYAHDITRRKQTDAEREKLQDQLVQARKMESVGRLAGGVAHDFNNKLMAILGNAEMCLQELPAGHAAREYLDEILAGARLSADLTRQLLAFARKQVIQPVVLDLHAAIPDLLKMLGRLLGEHIQLVWTPGAPAAPVLMDPSQLDQILFNLAANARDAIRGAGRLVIATAQRRLDEAALALLLAVCRARLAAPVHRAAYRRRAASDCSRPYAGARPHRVHRARRHAMRRRQTCLNAPGANRMIEMRSF